MDKKEIATAHDENNVDMKKQMIEMMKGLSDRLERIEEKMDKKKISIDEENVGVKKQMFEMMKGISDRLKRIEEKMDLLEKKIPENKADKVPIIPINPYTGKSLKAEEGEAMDESEDGADYRRAFGPRPGRLPVGSVLDSPLNPPPVGPGPGSLFVGGPLSGGRCGGLGQCSFC